ncbi:hypothetical protein K3152_08300 [Qipengyuania sp. 1NDH17]|uniref:DUF2868 domain-containing protein n=1 Tax=Qipengyuania polymorpha TaxID=2867234 RepID=A0ABS7J1Q7_9SPHN|nr:hypothetical protein [Qipengyuania polymorpha]MBX7458245.1 hypothetical protein [Qipengyuania polymorpha]
MRLNTRSISLEVKPSHEDKLVRLLVDLRGGRSVGREGEPGHYPDILARLPTCHFLSICMVESSDYDPLLVIEANFDGPEGPFWAQLQAVLGEALREALRCCKRPLDDTAELYDLVTAHRSRRDPAPFLERHVMRPKAFFHGNRGLPRERILAEKALAEAVEQRLHDGGGAWNGKSSEDVRLALRSQLMPRFEWLGQKPAARIPLGESLLDWAKLAAVLFLVLHLALVPGAILAALLGNTALGVLLALVAVPVWLFFTRYRRPAGDVGTSSSNTLLSLARTNAFKIIGALAVLFLLSWPVSASVNLVAKDMAWPEAWQASARQLAWGIVWLVAVLVPAALIWMRYLERHDSSQDGPVTDPVALRQMREMEDWIPQNHMVSVVSLRPQIPRRAMSYIGTPLIHLALRAAVRDGYLGSMRTIHCAQWAFVNNGSRLLFLSNYDLSWESYFDDFIEKAHEGVTAVWCGSVGFPPVTMIIEDGAAHGRAFKNWARHSMSPTRFWVSAYPTLTVDQIERNNRIANGLCAASLPPAAARQWADDL